VVLLLNLVDLINKLGLADMLPEWVEYLVEECAMAQLDQLGGHHWWRILICNTIGVVPLGLDGLQARDQCNHVLGNVVDHIMLVICFQTSITVSRERALILDVVNDRLGQDVELSQP
jgi:hypothetical protein